MKIANFIGLYLLLSVSGMFPAVTCAQSRPATNVVMVKVGEDYRAVQLHIPDSYDGTSPLPLVFNLHGSRSTAERQELLSGMFAVADEKQFLVAGGMATYEYPPGRRTWNADLDPDGVRDVDYIRAAIEAVNKMTTVDRNRITSLACQAVGE